MDLIDFDGLFDEKLTEYMKRNAGKYTEKQWEAVIPRLYQKFGDTYVSRAKNTPKGYYAAMTDEALTASFLRHLREGVPADDFLTGELERRGCTEALIALLGEKEPEILTAAVRMIGADERGLCGYAKLLEGDLEEELLEEIIEQFKNNADAAKPFALDLLARGIREELMLEVLSRCKERDEAVFEALLRAFKESGEEMPVRANYLAAYGDARALGALLDVVAREDINFLEYRELKFAIEALGGEYEEIRDFSGDAVYEAVSSQPPVEITEKKE
ncbi:MAG: hypothetical protein IKD43_04920 [Clostridia bacterium]|nr:hypothetical protein [Clostridia bacterium]